MKTKPADASLSMTLTKETLGFQLVKQEENKSQLTRTMNSICRKEAEILSLSEVLNFFFLQLSSGKLEKHVYKLPVSLAGRLCER